MSGYRLEDAFREAVALDHSARVALLDRLARENASLADELRELLEADARADARGLFERPAAADLAWAGVMSDGPVPDHAASDDAVQWRWRDR